MATDPSEQRPKIKIAAHVVVQLGQELVTDVEQAFLELAKNAYDADAEECIIHIDPDWEPPQGDSLYDLLDQTVLQHPTKGRSPRVGRVLITDTGIGANERSVTDGWLTISASLKRSLTGLKKKTTKGRTPVGDKGLGRLATMKIGDLLIFRTRQEDEPYERVTAFSWGEFLKVKTIDQVKVEQRKVKRHPPYEAGSVVEIVGLHDGERWRSEAGARRLVARLSQLVNPYVGFKNFEIQVRHGRKIYDLQKIGNEVLNFAVARFDFKWTGSELQKGAKVSKALFRGQRGEDARIKYDTVFATDNEAALAKKFKQSRRFARRGVDLDRPGKGWLASFSESDQLPRIPHWNQTSCGPLEGTIYYFLFNEEFTSKLQGNAASIEQVQEMSGIMVFRDGFRVRMGDDWLGLSEGTTSGNFYNLRPRNTLGYFGITNERNPNLIEKSDREGFVDNAALEQFMHIAAECKKYANEILSAARDEVNELYTQLQLGSEGPATPAQVQVRLKDSRRHAASEMQKVRQVASKALQRVEAVKKSLASQRNNQNVAVLRGIDEALENFSELGSGLSSVQQKVLEMEKVSTAIESFRKIESERNLRLLESAAVGLTARVLSHELLTYLDGMDAAIVAIGTQNKKIGNSAISDALRAASGAVRELRKVLASLNPLLPGSRAIKETLSLEPTIQSYVQARAELLKTKGVHIKVTGEGVRVVFRFSRTRFYQILENLLQNSLYWIQQSEAPSSQRAMIRIAIKENGFDWWDSGPGVVERYEETLFDAFISHKPRAEGQGLGLYIVSTFLEAERCSIELLRERNAGGRRYKFRVDLNGAIAKEK